MKNKKSIIKIVENLVSFGMRQGKATLRAGNYIEKFLMAAEVPFAIEKISATIPAVVYAMLKVDGKHVPCESTSFVSGSLKGNSSLASSLISSKYLIDTANINFNPQSESISRPNFYFAPSVAVRREDVARIIYARKVQLRVNVRKETYQPLQFLVGNRKDPEIILFTHFDSIGPGAIDNASGTAVCLSLILQNPLLLKKILVVLDPHEELSYDIPTYWGKGYRIFEERYLKLLNNAQRIIVVDSVGNGRPRIFRERSILHLSFPIKRVDKYASKIVSIAADINGLMKIYHSASDTTQRVDERYLRAAQAVVKRLIEDTIRRKNKN